MSLLHRQAWGQLVAPGGHRHRRLQSTLDHRLRATRRRCRPRPAPPRWTRSRRTAPATGTRAIVSKQTLAPHCRPPGRKFPACAPRGFCFDHVLCPQKPRVAHCLSSSCLKPSLVEVVVVVCVILSPATMSPPAEKAAFPPTEPMWKPPLVLTAGAVAGFLSPRSVFSQAWSARLPNLKAALSSKHRAVGPIPRRSRR